MTMVLFHLPSEKCLFQYNQTPFYQSEHYSIISCSDMLRVNLIAMTGVWYFNQRSVGGVTVAPWHRGTCACQLDTRTRQETRTRIEKTMWYVNQRWVVELWHVRLSTGHRLCHTVQAELQLSRQERESRLKQCDWYVNQRRWVVSLCHRGTCAQLLSCWQC